MVTDRPITGDQIRAAYLAFFEERGHLVVPSASLVPAGDSTLLLTPAGMAPFKPYYAGDEIPPNPRLTSVQKCFRTTDIDVVGDRTHHTMFEMLGNFSIGDYFKEQTIAWAWEFCTEILGLPGERLWVSVHDDDDEAAAIWKNEIGVNPKRIVRCGDADNFWGPAGDEGACGPSSEIHYDREPSLGTDTSPCSDETDRFIEIWNLVFPQFYQATDGNRSRLPAPGIDTGMGLERIAAIMQDVSSVYETDLLSPIVKKVEELSGVAYGISEESDFAIRVVAEHSRSATFLIADGVVPSNEGRGYVLRRVIRRGIRFARKLDLPNGFLSLVSARVVERMGSAYPELLENREFVLRTLDAEEERFEDAIAFGMPLLQQMITAQQTIDGKDVFLLYDTYGFPFELTQEIARERDVNVDVEGFNREMEAQRQRGRASARFGGDRELSRFYQNLGIDPTEFTGYESLTTETRVVGMLKDGQSVERANQGEEVEVLLERTPFYAEGGGQVGDQGSLLGEQAEAHVADTQKPIDTLIVHSIKVISGNFGVGDAVRASVDVDRRLDVMRNHTATHVLHSVLRDVLGSHVRQAGSLVAPDRLRFDFTHIEPVSDETLRDIEARVNTIVRENLGLIKREQSYRDAISDGALAFFDERYGESVRTVQIGDQSPVSFELCGGTHLDSTGQIGSFRLTTESSVGTGIRRIEAVTGRGSENWISEQLSVVNAISMKLRVPTKEISSRIDALLGQVDEARRTVAEAEREASRSEAQELLTRSQNVNGTTVVTASVAMNEIDAMRVAGDWIRDKLGSGIVALGGIFDGRPSMIVMVTPDLVNKGFSASDISKAAATAMGGGGGGRPHLAQAGGKDPSRLDDALATVIAIVRSKTD